MENRLKLPVGIENFEEIRRNQYYYIDKTKLKLYSAIYNEKQRYSKLKFKI